MQKVLNLCLLIFIILISTGLCFCSKSSKNVHQKLSNSQLDSINHLVAEYSRVPIMDYDEGRYGRYLTEELEAGGSPNARDSAGIPAIVLAALEAHAVSQVSILLKYGADANASGRDSVTALHAAASRGDSVMTDVLLKAYANPNLRDTSALTPLMYAVMHGAWVNYLRGISVVKMLINAGADVNAVNKNKVTVLQFACNVKGSLDIGFEEQRLKIVQLLLDKGADVTVRNSHGLTALDMAKILGKSDLIALIREYSKKQSSAGKTKK